MALDGLFLSRIKNEIEAVALGSRIEKITQPSRELLIFALRWRGGSGKLLLCAAPEGPRIHFTATAPENPKTPPMFCMLLRKHLSGSKLVAVRQVGMDRILHLDFEATNELGDLVTLTVAVEIMGRHSNIVVIGPEGKVLDAVRRVDLETSSVRQILPGVRYVLPPMQDKLNLAETDSTAILASLDSGKNVELSKALMDVLQGTSPLVCREIAHYATRGMEMLHSDLDHQQRQRLTFALDGLINTIKTGGVTPTMVLEPKGKPRDFSFIPIHQYGTAMLTKEYESCSILLDNFYTDRDRIERVRQRSGDLLKLLANTSDRIARKLAVQQEELKECAQRDELKMMGDLISANLYSLQKGDTKAVVQNFYHPQGKEIEIPLDPLLTPPQNAQRYYALYRKADTAEKMLIKLIAQGTEELAYIDSVFDALTRAAGEADLDAIRRELAAGGYVKRSSLSKQGQKEQKLAPIRYRSTDGILIMVGRNNLQNDQLTIKEAKAQDLWLHTQKIPGAHAIISTQGKEIPKTTIEQAAIIAAYNSKARNSTKVSVDFTPVKYVRKPNGAKPGMVIYDTYQTILVTPDEELVQSLLEK